MIEPLPNYDPLTLRVSAPWGRQGRGRCTHLAGWVTEAAGQIPLCGILHFAVLGSRGLVRGGGGPSSMDPLLSSFWGDAREGPLHPDRTHVFYF